MIVPILDGWNIWNVWQTQTPIEPTPGTLNDQLAAWVRDVTGLGPDLQVALVSAAAAGPVVASRASDPEFAGPVELGVATSPVTLRRIAFQSPIGGELPWPHDLNFLLDAAFQAAPAPGQPVPAPSTTVPSQPTGGAIPPPAPSGPSTAVPAPVTRAPSVLMLLLGLGLGGILLARGIKKGGRS